jgi:hypothetical protein
MDFACSRCAHRQVEDAECAGCGNDVVQDLLGTKHKFPYLDEYEKKRGDS